MEQWYSNSGTIGTVEQLEHSGTVTVEQLEHSGTEEQLVVQRNSGTEEHETILLKQKLC